MGCICKVKWENDKKQWVKDKKFDYLIIILYTAKWPKANEWGNGKNQMNEGMVKIKWIREWPKQMNEGMTKTKWMREWPKQMNEGMTKTNEWGNDRSNE